MGRFSVIFVLFAILATVSDVALKGAEGSCHSSTDCLGICPIGTAMPICDVKTGSCICAMKKEKEHDVEIDQQQTPPVTCWKDEDCKKYCKDRYTGRCIGADCWCFKPPKIT